MFKKITIFFSLIVGIIFITLIYLSTVGIKTSSFNSVIKKKVKNINEEISLNFSKTKILLDIKSLSLKIKLTKPVIKNRENEIRFHNLNSTISIKSYLKDEFALKNVKFNTKQTDIKKLVQFIRSTYPSPFVFLANNFINKGIIDLEGELFFDDEGRLKENYEISGLILNLETKVTKEHKLQKINSEFKIKKNFYQFNIKKINFHNVIFNPVIINIKKKKKDLIFSIDSESSGKIKNIKKFLSYFDFSFKNNNFDFLDLQFNLNNKINFKLKKFTKLKDLKIEGAGVIDKLILNSNNFKNYNEFFELEKSIEFKSSKFKYNYTKDNLIFESSGKFNLNDEYNNYKFEIKYNPKENSKIVAANFELNSLLINLKNLEYYKTPDKKSNIKINAIFGNQTLIKKLNYVESENNIMIDNLKLDSKSKILDFKQILIKTSKNKISNNDIKIIKEKEKINIYGKKYDATYFFKSLTENKNSRTLSEKFKGKLNINIDEVIAKNDIIYDFNAKGQINFGKIYKLNAKGNFSKNEFLDISIIPEIGNKKKLYIYSEKAKPFVENFKFVKGFTEGKLVYNSIYDDKNSSSNLQIYDFKVQNVPVLAKLLSLASLQGIADVLTGEGIRFNIFEMDFRTNENLTTINEIYALGPAISILMEGYIEKNKLVSLRGTLVPATTLNKVVGSIPLIGKILVGKKTGEGVFGVSFKIKGPPKDLKTSVNPIKTLTPRFITRTLEKIKKSN